MNFIQLDNYSNIAITIAWGDVMYKPKLVSSEVGKMLNSGLNKIRAYGHGNYSPSVMEDYSTSRTVISPSIKEAQNRLKFYKGLAIQIQEKRKCI